MASKFSIIFTIIVVVVAASPALATDYIVGDEFGWTLGVNYTAWAEAKQFFVGDTLTFIYNNESHNVYKVNGTAFRNCTVPPPLEALVSGNDVITLATPGRKWYICSVGQHCDMGMKLVITVAALPEAPTPSPAPDAGADDDEPMPMGFWNNWKLKLHV